MAMPRQLALARRPRRSTPRPLVEQLPRIDIADLCCLKVLPSNWYDQYHLELPFKYPFAKNLLTSLQNVEINHIFGYTQRIGLRWVRTGFGGHRRPRTLFVCPCGSSVRSVYFKAGHLACRCCQDATYASRACSKDLRPILQAKRLRTFFELKSYMWQSNRQRLKARLSSAPNQDFKSKRLDHHVIQLPQ